MAGVGKVLVEDVPFHEKRCVAGVTEKRGYKTTDGFWCKGGRMEELNLMIHKSGRDRWVGRFYNSCNDSLRHRWNFLGNYPFSPF